MVRHLLHLHTNRVHCLESFIVWMFPSTRSCAASMTSGDRIALSMSLSWVACRLSYFFWWQLPWPPVRRHTFNGMFHDLFKASAFGLVCTCRNLRFACTLFASD